jgi:hypothetical protein
MEQTILRTVESFMMLLEKYYMRSQKTSQKGTSGDMMSCL